MTPNIKPFFELNTDGTSLANHRNDNTGGLLWAVSSIGYDWRFDRPGQLPSAPVIFPEHERNGLFNRAQSLKGFAVAFNACVLSNA